MTDIRTALVHFQRTNYAASEAIIRADLAGVERTLEIISAQLSECQSALNALRGTNNTDPTLPNRSDILQAIRLGTLSLENGVAIRAELQSQIDAIIADREAWEASL